MPSTITNSITASLPFDYSSSAAGHLSTKASIWNRIKPVSKDIHIIGLKDFLGSIKFDVPNNRFCLKEINNIETLKVEVNDGSASIDFTRLRSRINLKLSQDDGVKFARLAPTHMTQAEYLLCKTLKNELSAKNPLSLRGWVKNRMIDKEIKRIFFENQSGIEMISSSTLKPLSHLDSNDVKSVLQPANSDDADRSDYSPHQNPAFQGSGILHGNDSSRYMPFSSGENVAAKVHDQSLFPNHLNSSEMSAMKELCKNYVINEFDYEDKNNLLDLYIGLMQGDVNTPTLDNNEALFLKNAILSFLYKDSNDDQHEECYSIARDVRQCLHVDSHLNDFSPGNDVMKSGPNRKLEVVSQPINYDGLNEFVDEFFKKSPLPFRYSEQLKNYQNIEISSMFKLNQKILSAYELNFKGDFKNSSIVIKYVQDRLPEMHCREYVRSQVKDHFDQETLNDANAVFKKFYHDRNNTANTLFESWVRRSIHEYMNPNIQMQQYAKFDSMQKDEYRIDNPLPEMQMYTPIPAKDNSPNSNKISGDISQVSFPNQGSKTVESKPYISGSKGPQSSPDRVNTFDGHKLDTIVEEDENPVPILPTSKTSAVDPNKPFTSYISLEMLD